MGSVLITQSGNLSFVEVSGFLGPLVGLIYVFKALRRRFGFIRFLGSQVLMCLGHGCSSLVGVGVFRLKSETS